ncbi:MAG: DUF4738 domain-containing protein [Prevotella sp.]|nr:DUF4738 domain-containing protein [Prevotella sp.]
MKRIYTLILTAAAITLTAGCSKEKKDSEYYKIPKQAETPADTAVHAMEVHDYEEVVAWNNSQYHLSIHRVAIDSMPVVHTSEGVKYKDNRIRIKILRRDSSVFFNQAFTKNSFKDILTPQFQKEGALLNLVYDGSDNDHLFFAGSVGDPDELSDEMIPLKLIVDRYGKYSYKVDEIDTHNDRADTTFIDDSYLKDEEDRIKNKSNL